MNPSPCPGAYQTMFGQLFTQVFSFGSDFLRSRSGETAFDVSISGEGGIDAGGPFREVMRLMAAELQPPLDKQAVLRLLIPCPNQVTKSGHNKTSWLLNPR